MILETVLLNLVRTNMAYNIEPIMKSSHIVAIQVYQCDIEDLLKTT